MPCDRFRAQTRPQTVERLCFWCAGATDRCLSDDRRAVRLRLLCRAESDRSRAHCELPPSFVSSLGFDIVVCAVLFAADADPRNTPSVSACRISGASSTSVRATARQTVPSHTSSSFSPLGNARYAADTLPYTAFPDASPPELDSADAELWVRAATGGQ